ncbi:MAG: glycosyltransferase family 2 protein [Candidatus Limivivens sp.]|nr:glycosyltransferase family 2 protein [Candidatus Limivivens sp.]
MSITAVIDHEEYRWGNGGTYRISGWAFSEKEERIEICLLGDGKVSLPCDMVFSARPDVKESRKDLAIKDDRIGFTVRLTALEQMFKNFHSLDVELVQGKERLHLLTRKTEEMKAGYRSAALVYFIDVKQIIGEDVVIHGWVIDAFRQERLSLRNEKGQQVPCELKRVCRNDVAKSWELEEGYRCGFQIRLPRKSVTGEKLILHMENEMLTKEYQIDMKRLDYENSKRGKLAKVLARDQLGKNREIILKSGISGFLDYVREKISTDEEKYMYWLKKHSASPRELKQQRKTVFPYQPRISIVVPLFNTPDQFLKEMVDSVVGQSYPNWELCLADGSTGEGPGAVMKRYYSGEKRIRYQRLEENRGIAGNTNAAIAMARGDYLLFADHDDLLARDALFEIVKILNEKRDTDIVYTDEDLVDRKGEIHSSPRFKPDFNLDFLRSINYICHIFVVRRSLAREAGLIRPEFDGAQDHEFILRCCERTSRIAHIPKILYHWRAHEGSTAGNQDSKQYAIDAGKRGLEEHYQRMGYDAEVEYTGVFIVFRTFFRPRGNPLVSVIIPNKDQVESLDLCLRSIFEKTDYPNYEILIVENNSTQAQTFSYYERIQREHDNVRVLTWKEGFNYSAINNFAVRRAKGDYLLFLNNDVEVITPSWMSRMVGCCQREDVGAVGAKLYYPDDTVQHGGIVVGIGWFAGHVQSFLRRIDSGYFGRLIAEQDISAVTGACMMVKRKVFEEVGGFEEKLAVALNDVDLCLKIRSGDHLIVFDPGTELYHYESKSRGNEDTPEKKERFKKEISLFRERWKEVLDQGDPYYNPNLTLCYGDCSIRRENEIPEVYLELFGGKDQ